MERKDVENFGHYEPRFQPQLWAICERSVRWLRKEYLDTFHEDWAPAGSSGTYEQLHLSSDDALPGFAYVGNGALSGKGLPLDGGLPLERDPAVDTILLAGQETLPGLEFPASPPVLEQNNGSETS